MYSLYSSVSSQLQLNHEFHQKRIERFISSYVRAASSAREGRCLEATDFGPAKRYKVPGPVLCASSSLTLTESSAATSWAGWRIRNSVRATANDLREPRSLLLSEK